MEYCIQNYGFQIGTVHTLLHSTESYQIILICLKNEQIQAGTHYICRMHFYVGSANFDWRSLTQVKELGVLAMNCPTLAEDMSKIFEVYWTLGGPNQQIPDE